MLLAVIVWICSLTISQCVVTITINNEGNNSNNCCRRGDCPCSNLTDALEHLDSNTIVNITSQQVTLDGHAVMDSRFPLLFLRNVRVLGNGATVMCNYKGSVGCLQCKNIIFEGITWDRCANTNRTQGITFLNAVDITISRCTFQYFNTCIGIVFSVNHGFIKIQQCQFLSNHVGGSVSECYMAYAALHIISGDTLLNRYDDIKVYVTETSFHDNGIFYDNHYSYSSLQVWIFKRSTILVSMHNLTVSASRGLGGNVTLGNAFQNCTAVFNEVVFMNNTNGSLKIDIQNVNPVYNGVSISSGTFTNNVNGSLKVTVHTPALAADGQIQVKLNNLTISGNKGTFSKDPTIGSNSFGQGTGILLWFASFNPDVVIAHCNLHNNLGVDSSIVYIEDNFANNAQVSNNISIVSSNFTSNHGPALYFANCSVKMEGYLLFRNNTAQAGSAIYLAYHSQVMIGNNSTLEFSNNAALLFGGAIYVDLLMNCPNQGIAFKNLPNSSFVCFTNNSAEIAGNSLYFSIPESCNIIRNSSDNNSIVYIPYQFKYAPLPGSTVPEISTSPYAVNLCSTECSIPNINSCSIGSGIMLGQSIYFNATACDYYNQVSESLQFAMECIDCNDSYRTSDGKILVHNGLTEFEMVALNPNTDISTNRNFTVNMTSFSSHGYKQIPAVISVELSPCHSGYIIDANSKKCECYGHEQNVIQCQHGYVEIKYGYWFGKVTSGIRTISSCPTYYCDFAKETELRDGYYKLPEEQNDQCSSHRAGMACGECTSGYTLAYDSPDCVNTDKCSPGMTALVVILTILYYIIMVVGVFGLMYFTKRISLGYTYGLLFYYSVVDVLLGSNLYISVGTFQLTTILSSFAKLTPQFLGKLCFVKGLSGVDQQFIHYAHALAVFALTAGIVIIANRWNKFALFVGECIIRVICLLLLLAYTSLASTSLQLMRPLYYDDIDGAYIYLSPSIKYFTDRHTAYGIIACVCGLFIVIGFLLLLFFQPFLRHKIDFIKIKPLLDQFQGCYKDQYHWFAAYYLICRLIIIGIAFIDALYYLQTVCVIIVMTHIWIWPYKSDALNVLDGIILLTMILIVNLGSYAFIESTTIALVVILVIFPLFLSCGIFLYVLLLSKWIARKGTVRYVM